MEDLTELTDRSDRVPTLDDVAARAGVSPATVSRFFNNPKIVAVATGQRIREAVKETGYIPNALAGGLASSKSKMVAVLIPHLTDSMFNDTIERMTEELSASGSNVMLGLTGVSVVQTTELIRGALSRRVDAIISTGPINEEIVDLVRRSPTLFIQIWELPDDPVGMAIGFSHRDAGRDVARFLAARGYQRPFLVTADGWRAKLRSNSFIEEWQSLQGYTPEQTLVDIPSRFGHARRAFAELRRLPDMPDVVVCGSDYLAQGMIIEAQAAGLSVPENLAVMGFGNSLLAGEMRPTITTVEIDGSRIAREVMAVIRRRGAGEEIPHNVIDVGFRIIGRDSA